METPKYKHDCARCEFLGRYKGQDLYTHKGAKPSYLLRYGYAGQDYISGKAFEHSEPELYQKAKDLSLKRVRYNPLLDEECWFPRPPEAEDYTAKDIREWKYVEGVYEDMEADSAFRELFVKVPWWVTPSNKWEIEARLREGLPAHTHASVVRFAWNMPKGVMYAYDH